MDMAAQMFDCPAAAVNLVGDDHVFIVSAYGIDEYDPGRDVSFCAHAINQGKVLVVPDATLDPRFHDNPLVEGGFIRFYAGVPIMSREGHALGALCVLDTAPHLQFPPEDQQRLMELAKLAADRLELRRLHVAAETSASHLEASAATSPNAIVCFDADARITAWNEAAAQMFGHDEQQALGQPLDLIVAEEDRAMVHAGIARVLGGGSPRQEGTALTARRRDGGRFPVELNWSRWMEGGAMHFGAIIRDMTQKRSEEEALIYLANYDPLTGLPNRNRLYGEITRALSEGVPLSLIVTDLEGFRDTNNTMGHETGDLVLRIVAGRIREVVPSGALFARIGGDEFGTLLSGANDPVMLGDVARRINAALAEPIVVDGQEVRLAGNCGMAIAPQHGETVEELLGSANLALFQARSEAGRGGTCLFHPALRAEAVARRMYDAELHRAFERDEFMLFYQPQMLLADNSLAGAEALIRWRHPVRGLLAPGAFLPALEAGVLADRVGRWILDEACAQTAAWRKYVPGFTMGVNLFAAQFRDGNLPQTVIEALERHKLPPDAIDLEITENIILDRQEEVLAQLQALRDAGFGLSFDDFGTGFASLNLLRNFPVSQIKIDKGFTQVMHDSPRDKAIVFSLIDLAGQLGLKVVAEGVESREDRDLLRDHGCDKGQGYFFGMPVPAALFEEQFMGGSPEARRA
ncbi:EAL domain-containing protein [Erythrobacter sp. SG61-1L]|uniref:putative bifunctional diguanylate cyclase/phosphodiesterase n=1 Tax=Erythrobacter sp. SG61-1L TaxID=1603897 RepID=UPI00240F37C1|nr:EAL domain-containing protein [Erythrobacter sp. SG61-1L]